MEMLSANVVGKSRRVSQGGREYLVVPASLIVPGVLNGSQGPLYYPLDEQKRWGHLWDGMPIVVRHPVKNGKHVSAKDPDILRETCLGSVRSPRVNGKTGAEAWFDIELARNYDRKNKTDLFGKVERGEPVELSTGLFTENEPAPPGSKCPHTGRAYTHIARNYRPDHLALLPDEKGACSVEDGCGFNVNSKFTFEGEDCPECGASMEGDPDSGRCNSCGHKWGTLVENADLEVLITELSEHINANAVGQVRSKVTGFFKRWGAGTGKGETHEAAQRGAMTLTDAQKERGKDAKTQAEAGHNPPSWAVDEATWERAKAAADKGGYDEESYYAVVTHIYEKMGGEIAAAGTENANNGEREHTVIYRVTTLTSDQGETIMPTKAEKVTYLTANCDCWKGQEVTLNTMTDEQLDKHIAHVQKEVKQRKERDGVFNALKTGVKLAGSDTATLTVNAEGKLIVKNNLEEGYAECAPDDVKCIEMMAAKKKEAPEEKPAMNEQQQQAVVGNVLRTLGFSSVDEAKATLNSAREIETAERRKLVAELVGNIADEQARKARAVKLLKMPVADLRERVADIRAALAANRQETLPGASADDNWDPGYRGTVYAPGGPAFHSVLTDNEQADYLPDMDAVYAEVDKVAPVTANASQRMMKVLGRIPV